MANSAPVMYALVGKERVIRYFPTVETAEVYARENKIYEYRIVAITLPDKK